MQLKLLYVAVRISTCTCNLVKFIPIISIPQCTCSLQWNSFNPVYTITINTCTCIILRFLIQASGLAGLYLLDSIHIVYMYMYMYIVNILLLLLFLLHSYMYQPSYTGCSTPILFAPAHTTHRCLGLVECFSQTLKNMLRKAATTLHLCACGQGNNRDIKFTDTVDPEIFA